MSSICLATVKWQNRVRVRFAEPGLFPNCVINFRLPLGMSPVARQLVSWREKRLRCSTFRCELGAPCGRVRVIVCALRCCAGPGGPLFVCLNFLF